uniref:Uncharacterized protein n=1 Tax=Timema cristinae TaxID=61476 RepID=A0A7R9H4E4_TIMCR|nr:unnamed protein product [Timema cristinae]
MAGHLDLANEQIKLLHNVEPHSVNFVGKREKDSLVCGDVDGKFKTLFTKVENINTKSGPFDFLLCVGDFFGSSADSWTPYKDGKLSVPIATYVLGPSTVSHGALYPDMNGGELAPNVSYLEESGRNRRELGEEGKQRYTTGVTVREEQMNIVKSFKYLDSIVEESGRNRRELGEEGKQRYTTGVTVREEQMNMVKSFKYLDIIVEESGRNRREVGEEGK